MEGLQNILLWPFRKLKNRLSPEKNKVYFRFELTPEEIDSLGAGMSDYHRGRVFEEYIANLYRLQGNKAWTTGELREQGLLPPSIQKRGGSGEQGVDVVLLAPQGEKIAIQCKLYKGKVDNKAIQEIVAALPLYEAQFGVVITNNYFTGPAQDLAASNGVLLIDREGLQQLIKNTRKKLIKRQESKEKKQNKSA